MARREPHVLTLLEWDEMEGDFLPGGLMKCNNCGREPCRCGVPQHFVNAFDELVAIVKDHYVHIIQAGAQRERNG